ncbi:hypothetical protein [Thioalkalivibrio sp. XN279]|uniref:InlB B-repeat-containing protein n=1 Tax=Thioalkalivibrio sp. XN279 TaxID=2714953 RepID=UPI00140D5AF5|nr:hypothetical protein [Thioalkalivibrio sp. XN279]
MASGETASFEISADTGSTLTNVSGCGGSLVGTTYTTGPITAACTVSASFSLNTYEVTATAGAGGGISPSLLTVQHGSTTSFTLTPDTGYSIASVLGCGGSLEGQVYTTGPITGVCSVTAEFAINTYEVAATAGPGGSVTPESRTVAHGSTARFALMPDEGYEVEQASGCEGEIDGTDYVTGPVTADCEVNVSFIARQFSIVLSSSSGGSTSGAGVYTFGEEATLTATVGAGYDFSGWFEAGILVSSEPVYRFVVDSDRNIAAAFNPFPDVIVGRVAGFDPTRTTLVTLSSVDTPDTLESVPLGPDGAFIFSGLREDQRYQVSVSQRGNRFVPVVGPEVLADSVTAVPPMSFETTSGQDRVALPGSELEFHGLPVAGLESDRFVYEWFGDVSVAGYEYSSYVNEPLATTFDGKDLSDVDGHSAATLIERFGVVLVDDEMPWSPEHATRLLQGMERTGEPEAMGGHVANPERLPYPSRWALTADTLPNDIEIAVDELGDQYVRISASAFTYASPMLGTIEGKRGRFFSNRLFKSIVRFVTDHGRDISKAAEIIQRRYGVRIATDAYFDGIYETIPVIEVDRSASVWQTFHPEEVVELIAMLEEFPEGMRDISFPSGPGGLRYILRRRDGLPHPLYPQAPAVAWTGAHYIEFLDIAFAVDSLAYIQRLIIHEKAHFLWDYSLSAELKYDWLKLSGWYRSDGTTDGLCDLWQADPMSWIPPNTSPADLSALTEAHDHPPGDGTQPIAEGWASCSTTQFVSAYAAANNPGEDMAESISYFLTNPDQLRSTSLPKYEFIRDFIMQGSVYVSLFRPDLTFEVLNLYPDYVYPGKIERVQIEVLGAPDEDKQVTVTLGLSGGANCAAATPDACFEGASGGFMRLLSRLGTFQDVYFNTANGAGLDNTLVARFTLSSEAAAGWWSPRDIAIFDGVGNRRVQKMTNSDFGWQLYVSNANEDIVPPEYVVQSMSTTLFNPGEAGASPDLASDEKELVLSWRVRESSIEVVCFARVIRYSEVEAETRRFYDLYADATVLPGGQSDGATHTCEIRWRITRFMPSGVYGPGFISLRDRGYNWASQEFALDHPTYEVPPTIDVFNPFEDLAAPLLNISPCATDDPAEECIRISGTPVNPESPDGETIVRISYWAYEETPLENASGVSIVTLALRNPQGQEYFWYHGDGSTGVAGRSPSIHRPYFECPSLIVEELGECDATTKIKYEFEVRLPVGSAPGIWGLVEMTVSDFAGNFLRVQFTEVIRFDLE